MSVSVRIFSLSASHCKVVLEVSESGIGNVYVGHRVHFSRSTKDWPCGSDVRLAKTVAVPKGKNRCKCCQRDANNCDRDGRAPHCKKVRRRRRAIRTRSEGSAGRQTQPSLSRLALARVLPNSRILRADLTSPRGVRMSMALALRRDDAVEGRPARGGRIE